MSEPQAWTDADEVAFNRSFAHASATGHQVNGMHGAPYLCKGCDWASTHLPASPVPEPGEGDAG